MSTTPDVVHAPPSASPDEGFLMMNPAVRVTAITAEHVVLTLSGMSSTLRIGRPLYDVLGRFRCPARVSDLGLNEAQRAAFLRTVQRLREKQVLVSPSAIGVEFSEADRVAPLAACPFTGALEPHRVRQLMGSQEVPLDADWILNPEATLQLVSDETPLAIRIAAPVREKGLHRNRISRERNERLFDVVMDLCHGVRPTSVDAALLAALTATGLAVTRDAVARPVAFRLPAGPLSDLGRSHLTPRGLGRAAVPDEDVRLLRACLGEDEPRDGDAAEARDAIDATGAMVLWCDDEARGITWPLWVDPDQADEVRHWHDDRVSIARKTEEVRATWHAVLVEARTDLETRGYAVVRDLLPPPVIAGLTAYYERLAAEGYLLPGDTQARRDTLHNERAACWLHRQTKPLIDRLMPEAVKCSYSYLGLYHGGAVLARHTDRAQCEYTLSLTIDARPSARREDAWPLYLEPRSAQPDDSAAVRVLLAPGDAAIFKGRTIPHYREALDGARRSWSIFLHYVPAAFDDELD